VSVFSISETSRDEFGGIAARAADMLAQFVHVLFCCVCRCATVGYDDWRWIIRSARQHKGDIYM